MNKYDPRKHHRRSIRLQDYNYASAGCYFVTICVRGGLCLLGQINEGNMILNEYGRIALESWLWLAERYDYISLDEYTILPNHLHGIVVYHDTGPGGSRTAPTGCKPLGNLLGAFKTVSTKKINNLRVTPGEPFWQRNYWEHIIRNEQSLAAIRNYIANNPLNWGQDKLHPDGTPNQFNKTWS